MDADMANAKERQLQQLREILLSADKKRLLELQQELEELRAQIADTDNWLEQLDPVIAAALAQKIHESKDEMAEALAPVMGPALKHQIDEAKDDIADALYPVIGKTIRKSISESMKQLVQVVNERLDKALSFKSVTRRIKGKMSGLSDAELALRDILPFRVNEVFLIHKESGLLLAHATRSKDEDGAQQDIVSGMLTAIRDFAKSAFKENSGGELNQIQYDDLQIALEDGRYAYLAIVYNGNAPSGFESRVKDMERKIHNRFFKALRHFDGDLSSMEDCPALLSELLVTRENEEEKNKNISYAPLLVFLIVIFGMALSGSAYFEWWPFNKKEQQAAPVLFNPNVDQALAAIKKHMDPRYAEDLQRVSVVADSNLVVLSGFAESPEARLLIAHELARQLPGATVLNNLALKPQRTKIQQRINNIHLYFENRSSEITERIETQLDSIYTLWQYYPQDTLYVRGFSENAGTPAVSLRISRERAQNVSSYLQERGLPQALIKPVAMGAATASEGNVDMGRRVDFNLKGRQ